MLETRRIDSLVNNLRRTRTIQLDEGSGIFKILRIDGEARSPVKTDSYKISLNSGVQHDSSEGLRSRRKACHPISFSFRAARFPQSQLLWKSLPQNHSY
jgi:hypothetical protein